MSRPKLYIDSCCFIEAVKGDVGNAIAADRVNELWFVRHCMKAGEAGKIDVITSTLTIAESRRADAPPTDLVKKLFKSILTSGKVVQLAQVTQSIAEKARDLHWEHNINLGGADAIHVATALAVGCKELLTFDRKKAKSPLAYAPELGKLGLKVILPSDTLLLPPEYLQGTLPVIPNS